ncbi:MAG: hypothetical protein C4547_11820 [Phycisphaerales bacterium]|nr:MAG: hypothetical protein C4547_11820 [Phycisphaerales bacterium]
MDQIEIVEAYLPARVEYLANLYEWLREHLYSHPKPLVHGFSIYEVNGAFRGTKDVYQERTTVVRIVFDLPRDGDDAESRAYEARLREIFDTMIRITEKHEEELWLIRIPARRETA